MKNRKQMLADFYLDLLAQDEMFKNKHAGLYHIIKSSLAIELDTSPANIEMIFNRMAAEDK